MSFDKAKLSNPHFPNNYYLPPGQDYFTADELGLTELEARKRWPHVPPHKDGFGRQVYWRADIGFPDNCQEQEAYLYPDSELKRAV